jgi:hypothetical protein
MNYFGSEEFTTLRLLLKEFLFLFIFRKGICFYFIFVVFSRDDDELLQSLSAELYVN